MKNTNFKKMLATIGVVGLAVPTSLSVAAVNNTHKQSTELATNLNSILATDEEQIVGAMQDAVNKVIDLIAFTTKSTADDFNFIINNDLTHEAIRYLLPTNLRDIYNPSLLKFNKATVDGKDLADEHFANSGGKVLNIVVSYDYGSLKNNIVNLAANVKQVSLFATDEEQIVGAMQEAANKIISYIIISNETTAAIFNAILNNDLTREAIRYALPENLQKIYNPSSLKINKATVDGKDLADEHFVKAAGKVLNIDISYDYGTLKGQSLTLAVNVVQK